MDTEGWPPHECENVPRRIFQRLEALSGLTQIRSSSWENDTARVAVWPYSDEIVAAVHERLAPLEAVVEPQDWLPQHFRIGQ